ncbi:hypothetical protein B0T22DRAFT_429924 [Podospora appendiculata]|uniref:Cyclopropane-fatty-acyl-phospholipid synthase n=1 Tax=Podospora appendiculata TaxID=314037 RepID=A0AAE0X697_9PEZI|nr:hypothetical protein B0T22DRAFT_429924 [Podospora appendiculata]
MMAGPSSLSSSPPAIAGSVPVSVQLPASAILTDPVRVSLAIVLAAVGYSALCSGPYDVLLLLFLAFVRQDLNLASAGFGGLFSWSLAKPVGGSMLAFLTFQLFRLRWTRADQQPWYGPGKALLFPCCTTHSRMFPEKHSFSYSYLVVGVPVGWQGTAGGMISTGVKTKSGLSSWFSLTPQARKGWYDIDAGDYLQRGMAELGLRGKLDAYLRTQDVDPAIYPHAYLVTAARFLGYHFNPVSFWYLYDVDKSLAAMILEVNNTFDERRMYLLTPKDDSSSQIAGESKGIEQNPPPRTVLKQSWPKDFHVSPFNSRQGSYSLTAVDPLSPFMQGTGPLTNTINLVSSKGHGKLVARLIPDGDAVDPATMTFYHKFRFLAAWGWVGFATFPRIVKEAGLLFFRRKLHVWFKPEPLKESIGRHADTTERQLEAIFRRYLRHLVEQSTEPLAVKYISAGLSPNKQDDAAELMLSPAARDAAGAAEELEIKVLTPVFYSRFVHYAHDLEAFFCELNESCTVWVSRQDLLPKFVLKKPSPTLNLSSLTDFACFKIIQRLRTRPERIQRPLTSSAAAVKKPATVDIRDFRISSMDGYVLAHEAPRAKAAYKSCVLTLFLADRIALGMVPLLGAQRLVLHVMFAWLLSPSVGSLLTGLVSAVRRIGES